MKRFREIVDNYRVFKNSRLPKPEVYIKDAGKNPNGVFKGMGVFAERDFLAGEIVELCHIIILDWPEKYMQDKKILQYAYTIDCHCQPDNNQRLPCLWNCPAHGNRKVLPLGYGLIYNSSDFEQSANTKFLIVPDEMLQIFYAIKNVKKDEELLTWWGQAYYDKFCKE